MEGPWIAKMSKGMFELRPTKMHQKQVRKNCIAKKLHLRFFALLGLSMLYIHEGFHFDEKWFSKLPYHVSRSLYVV